MIAKRKRSAALRRGTVARRAKAAVAIDIAAPVADQLAAGREARTACPRSSHAPAQRTRYARDPVALLIESNHDRLENLIPVRHSRMLESPFAFFRGSAVLQAHDLAATARSGIEVQACGDCHLLNFGGFATPERNLIFDINDFDETHPAPWEWDVKRLAASLVLAARWRGFSKETALEAATRVAGQYRRTMRDHADMSTMDTWYSQLTVADIFADAADDRKATKRLAAVVKEARTRTSEHVFGKLTKDVDGTPRIVDQPPLIYHPPGENPKGTAETFIKLYTSTLREEIRMLLSRFHMVDAALKVVGVGSVGTRCHIVLFMGVHGDPLFLQVKEARKSVLERHAGKSPWGHEGQRVVVGQRLMQAASDIFLGWAKGPNGRDFYVRQLRDMKVSADVTAFDADTLVRYGRICGRALARGHAKSGSAAAIAGYLGNSAAFDEAVGLYAIAYADQAERDYAAFQVAARNGRIATETTTGAAVDTMVR